MNKKNDTTDEPVLIGSTGSFGNNTPVEEIKK